MKCLRINFVDFWHGFNPQIDPVFGDLLNSQYDVIYTFERPDIVIFSVFGNVHKNYSKESTTKIFYTPENFLQHHYPALDGVLGFDHVWDYANYSITSFTSNDFRNYRMPCYIRRRGFKIKHDIEQYTNSEKTKTAIYLQSSCLPERDNFAAKLMDHIDIDCPGRCLKNMSANVLDKLQFIKDYKFVLAIENSSTPGYSSEKITDPFIAGSVPIYRGDPNIADDFNEDSFINYHSYDTDEKFIEDIIELNSNEEKYNSMLKNSKIKNHDLFDEEKFMAFFQKVVK